MKGITLVNTLIRIKRKNPLLWSEIKDININMSSDMVLVKIRGYNVL